MAAIDTPTAPPAPTPSSTAVVRPGGPDEVAHGYCMVCKSRLAWCGYVRPNPPPVGTAEAPRRDRCVVCLDLRRQPCPTCGAPSNRPAT